ncbi:MAG: zinc-binding dehydrogenase [Prolixibacteraceae bacterium]|mgnify:CR=1 FL=1|jgi:NADPH:quinone reductase|nr:zinc-binding dehydrogenase [Prolixibacteraceae bacterium]MBT6004938.1 zinc-binding dehydrogenase [Prolixibacteraceae bacterium]MBT6765617.1 zinc-binding dehydrogenase [Prolixibacteraceae bacterium]MBT6997187.1 zinc-binding dehydrogenase [Prolixibacteraceae bacterium]MBT7396937.1 zinc-binding dehydrogenase [Prolixibacteraceae bacterium]
MSSIPENMKAVILSEGGAKPQVANIPVPQPGAGEVLVKMHASPINPSDLAFLEGGYGIEKKYPAVPGFEGSGTVVAAGKGVLPKLWMGKKVACAASPIYDGCWAEYMVTKAGMCVPLSKNISLDQASMMFVNPMTALAFFDIYKKLPNPTKKHRGIINTAGASALGRMVIKFGQKQGIPVISVVRREEQVEILKADGAEYIVDSSDPNFETNLKKLAHQLNATVIFDAVGGEMVQMLLDAAPKGSNLFIYGRLSADACEISPGDLIFTGNQIRGFWLTCWLHSKSFLQSIMNTRKIQSLLGKELGTTIHQKFSIEQISEALEIYQNNMSKGKVLIQF